MIRNFYKVSFSILMVVVCQNVYGQNQSFSGGFGSSVMVCKNGEVFHTGDIPVTTSFVKVLKGQQTLNATAYLNKIVQVNGGSGGHDLALACDGSVFTWGSNGSGQLGNATTTASATPVLVLKGLQASSTAYLENVKYVGGGNLSSYALLNDGTVMSWGDNSYGQLGDGSIVNKTSPVFVLTDAASKLSGITQIYGGERYAIALKSDGTVWIWGDNYHDELGQGPSSPANTTYAIKVKDAAGTGFLSNIVKLAGGDTHVLALSSDMSVWAWGGDWANQLGDGGGKNDQSLPVKVIAVGATAPTTLTLSNVVNITAGSTFSMALLNDGQVVAWGDNTYGDVGNGTTTATSAPVYVRNSTNTGNLTGIVDISKGDNHAFAMDGDGQLYTWGRNQNGQLGIGSTTNSSLPKAITMPCTLKPQCPTASLGPDVTLCNPISVTLFAGSDAPNFSFQWYKDGVLLTSVADNYAMSAYLTVNATGTYKVVIADTSASTTCTPCPTVEDQVVITTSSVAPINNTFCAPPAKNVTLGVSSALNTFDWYSASTGGTLLKTGSNSYTTPLISATTTYYVEDTRTYSYNTGYSEAGGSGLSSLTSGYNTNATQYMNFTVYKQLTLVSVVVKTNLTTGCTGTRSATINLRNMSTNTIVQSSTYASVVCIGNTTFPLNFSIAPGTYRLEWTGSNNVLYYDAGALYPRGITGLISLTGTGKFDNSSSSSFFDWVISSPTSCGRIPVIATLTAACPLPVEFVSFQGTKINEASYLSWQTANEKNNYVFEVERSLDGINFIKVGDVYSKGNTGTITSYQFVDNNTSEINSLVYYRLKQVDTNHSSSYSQVIAINYSSRNAGSLSVFPNPVKKGDELHLSILSGELVDVQIQISDLTGKEIYSSQHKLLAGHNDVTINTSSFPSGLYFMHTRISNSPQVITKVLVE